MRRIFITFSVLVPILMFFLVIFSASVLAIARGYSTKDNGLQSGMVVALSEDTDKNNSSDVERASQDSGARVVGVTTTIKNSLVTVSSGSAEVLVEGEGQVEAYVSSLNGEVRRGDRLVLSPLKGILMKSSDQVAGLLIGLATGMPTETSEYSYQDAGTTKKTQISKVSLNLNIQGQDNLNKDDQPEKSSISRLGKSVLGRDISESRVIMALVLFLVVLIAEVSIIYSAISSSVISLGRNPLASKVIRGELVRLLGIATVVLLVGLAALHGLLFL